MSETKFKNTYRIDTTRAKWHAYDGGIYFVTICVQDRSHKFGNIYRKDGETYNTMEYSYLGKYTIECMLSINQHYQNAEILLFTVMPNHIHALISIHNNTEQKDKNLFEPQRNNLASVIRSLKGSITKYANDHNIPFKWQSRYYDHIVRNNEELNHIAEYIQNNIDKWDSDSLNE